MPAAPLLSAAMIVRDEEAHLSGCLESIRPIVDEIVVIDTGSTDRTTEIARGFGARVQVHPWEGDFSRARNAALELARGAWILYIDADERLRPIPRASVRTRLREASEVALRVRLRPFTRATPYWETRIWRSDPRIRFAGRIHERIGPAIDAVAAEDHLTLGDTELYVEHLGYDGPQTRKHERNVPLLRAQLATDEGSVYDWSHLSTALVGLGNSDEADAALKQAVEAARRGDASAGGVVFAELIRRLREQRDASADALLDEALALYPDSIALAWQKVCLEVDAARYETALRWLERFDADPDMPVEDMVAYPAELIGAQAPQARGLCLFRLGRYGEAADAYRQAEAFDPQTLSHSLKRVVAEERARLARESEDAPRPTAADGVRWAARDLLSGAAVEVGGVSVGLRATDAVRAGAIHELLGRMAPSHRAPNVELTFGRHLVPFPEREEDETQGSLRLWHDDDAFAGALGTAVSGRAEAGTGRIGGHTRDLGSAFRAIAPFVLASLLAPRGRFVLHAAAIEREGRTVLVLGDSGAGKSTLIFGAIEDGWSVLADDLVVVRAAPSGPSVSGIPKALVVPAEILGERSGEESRRADTRSRVRIPFEAWKRGWHPVGAVVLVGHGTTGGSMIEAVGRPGLLGLLLRAMLCRQPTAVRPYVGLAVTLSELPGGRLVHSDAPQTRAHDAAEAVAGLLS